MKTYENQSDAELINRIQSYVDGTVTVAHGLEIRDDPTIACPLCEADRAIYPFAYIVDGCEMRGAFTNGDPVWEEEDAEAFQKMMGEEE